MSITSDIASLLDRVADLEDQRDADRERIATLEEHLTGLIAQHDQHVAQLEQELADHQAGALERQRELDRLGAQYERLRYAQRTGRQP